MKKYSHIIYIFLFIISLTCPSPLLFAQCSAVSGTVFNDYNANGTQDSGELGVAGITVTAYDGNNSSAASAITASDGSYSINGLNGSYRIEFTNLPDWLTSGPYANSTSETSVQFVEGTNCTANFGVHNPMDYCTENPLMSTPCYIEGDPLAGGSSGTRDWLVTFDYNNSGEINDNNYPEPTHKIDGTVIGSTWGVAYHRRSQSLFAGAMIKRHTGLGTGGTGEIYRIDLSSGTPNPQTFIDLDSYAGINTGTDPRDGSANNTLPSEPNSNSRDVNAFNDVGKKAIGDIDLSEDEQTLYAINLNDRTLHQIPIGNNPTAPTNINTYDPIAAMATLHPGGCGTPDDYRPWALKVYQGLVYVGLVCSAESSQDATELQAYILAFDPMTNTFSAVFDFSLNYGRDDIIDYQGSQISGNWRPWINSWNQVSVFGGDNNAGAPQPILSDIEFDRDGAMILGFIDRFGHQSGFLAYSSNPNDDDLYIGISGGETLRACKTATGFELEGNGACAYNDANEFYDQDFFFDNNVFGSALGHYEISVGGLALSKLKDEVAVTIFDPYWIQSGGIAWWHNNDGSTDHVYELYNFDETSNGGPFGKASGLGDLELLCPPAPLEIGNRIWADTDGDGIQDPDELGIDGVTVNLYLQDGTLVGQTTTANGGHYVFTNSNVNLNGATGLLYDTNYVIALDDAANYNNNNELDLSGTNYGVLTTIGTGTGHADLSDSDGLADSNSGIAALNNFPYISLTTGDMGENNHTYDFGFWLSTPDCLPINCLSVQIEKKTNP